MKKESNSNILLPIIKLILTVILIPLIGYWYSNSQNEIVTQQKYVELSVNILMEKPSDENMALREWAVSLLVHYAPKGLKPDSLAQKAMIRQPIISSSSCPPGYEPGPDGWSCVFINK